MSASRVLILSSQALFAESLCSLVQRDGGEVIGMHAYDASVAALIVDLKPTVVVLDTHNVPATATATLLDCAPSIRIVHVSLEGQGIAMYDHRQPPDATVQEFLDFVALRDKSHSGAVEPDSSAGEQPG